MPKKILTPIEERFWPKTEPEPNSGCLLWTASAVTCNGKQWYGVIGAGGRKGGTVLAHRVAFVLAGGELSPGMDVMHTCDNSLCVNAAHLVLGTRQDNMRHCSDVGRAVIPGREERLATTHCPRGHEYTIENTGVSLSRSRYRTRRCRTCHRDKQRVRSARKRGVVVEVGRV